MRQKFGQNFLIDNNIVNNIIKAAELVKDDCVLEIGPGKGILTKAIQPLVKKLAAVEIDKILADQLKHYFNFHNITNVEIINNDFLQLEINGNNPGLPRSARNDDVVPSPLAGEGLAKQEGEGLPFNSKFKIISNLPYNVGTAILQQILPESNWTVAVVMLQKEVIERLAAKPGGKDYGYISIFTQVYANAEILFTVSPSCFNPKPEVMSAVIKLTNKNSNPPNENFFPLVKHSFSMRRKTILNCLSSFMSLRAAPRQEHSGINSGGAAIQKTAATDILQKAGIDPMLRPDKLSIADFDKLANLL